MRPLDLKRIIAQEACRLKVTARVSKSRLSLCPQSSSCSAHNGLPRNNHAAAFWYRNNMYAVNATSTLFIPQELA